MAGRLLYVWLLCCCTSLLVNAQNDSDAPSTVANTRNLAAAVPKIVPPGTQAHHHPVGITLTAGPGDVVFYTVDGSLPNRTSAFVQSGQYVVVSANSTVRAMAAPSATVVSQHCSSDVPGGESAVATKTYTVYMQLQLFAVPQPQKGAEDRTAASYTGECATAKTTLRVTSFHA
eukprot:10712-Heterococcus_DN1.PRE.1